MAGVWIPLAASLTSANAADNEEAPALIRELPTELRFLLGDVHYLDSDLERLCQERGIILVTSHNTKGHPYPHTDSGVEVRRVLHKTRSLAIENFNEQFKSIFDGHASVPTRDLCATRRFVRSCSTVCRKTQLVLLLAYPYCVARLGGRREPESVRDAGPAFPPYYG